MCTVVVCAVYLDAAVFMDDCCDTFCLLGLCGGVSTVWPSVGGDAFGPPADSIC